MRKGIHATYAIAGFVILVVVLVLSVSVFTVMKNMYEKTEHDSRCGAQIAAHAATVKFTTELKAPEVVCPTARVHITDQDEPEQVIAQEMKRCWDMWGKGELRLFGDAEGIYCHVCSMVYVDGENITGFGEYLDEVQVKDGRTYAQYLAGKEVGMFFDEESAPTAATAVLQTDAPLGVMFYYAKGQQNFDKLKNLLIGDPELAPVKGAAIGLALAYLGPFGWVSGSVIVVGGAITWFYYSLQGRDAMDYMSVIVVRPLTDDDIKAIGCTYAPVANT